MACHAAGCISDHVVLAQLDLPIGKYGKPDAHFAGDGFPNRGVVHVYAGFFDELCVDEAVGSGEARDILVGRDLAIGANAMAAESKRGLLDGALDSGHMAPDGGVIDCAAGL